MKDPAFLFYYQDFLVGTDDLTNEEVGAYIRCLCHQASKGTISEKHMIKICSSHDIHNAIKSKFKMQDDGNFANERLLEEVRKRAAYAESRRNNRRKINASKPNSSNNISSSYVQHMENENENENENVIVNKNVNDNVNVIPSIEEFIAYAVSNVSDINTEEVRLKYQSWKVNNWCTNVKGKEKPIKNWKSTLLNTLPYLSRTKPEELSLEQLQYNHVQKMLNFKDTTDYSNAD